MEAVTIYVDNIFIPARVGRINGKWCHLMTDGPAEELHAFAQSIGLKRSWAQHEDRPDHLHYDVTEKVRAKAVAAGAVEVSWRDIAGLMKHQREMERRRTNKPRWPSARRVGRLTRFVPKESMADD